MGAPDGSARAHEAGVEGATSTAAPAVEAAASGPPPPSTQQGEPAKQPFVTTGVATEEEEDDADETCGFCRFMKGGGCRAAFTAWSKCVDRERDAGSDYTEECREKTLALRECMLQHQDYYRPLLEEEEEMLREEQAAGSEGAASAVTTGATEQQHEGKPAQSTLQ